MGTFSNRLVWISPIRRGRVSRFRFVIGGHDIVRELASLLEELDATGTSLESASSSRAASRRASGCIPASDAMDSRSVRVGPSSEAGSILPSFSNSAARLRRARTSSSE